MEDPIRNRRAAALALIEQGWSFSEVARALGCSIQTVWRYHWSSLAALRSDCETVRAAMNRDR